MSIFFLSFFFFFCTFVSAQVALAYTYITDLGFEKYTVVPLFFGHT